MVEVVIAIALFEAAALALARESEEAVGKEESDDDFTVEVHVVEVTVERGSTEPVAGSMIEMLDDPGIICMLVDLEIGEVDCNTELICGDVTAVEGDAETTLEEEEGLNNMVDDPRITGMLVDLEAGEVDRCAGLVCEKVMAFEGDTEATEEGINGVRDDAGITGTLDDLDAGGVG